jgi:hypothetical protein
MTIVEYNWKYMVCIRFIGIYEIIYKGIFIHDKMF